MILYISHQLGNKEERNSGSFTIDFRLWCFKENINVVSLGIDLDGIEVDKYALFISNVISFFSFLILLRHFYVKYVDELHSRRNKTQLSLLDLCLCYFSIVQVKPTM